MQTPSDSLAHIRDRQSSQHRDEAMRLKREHTRSHLNISFEDFAQLWEDFAQLAREYCATDKENYGHKLRLLLKVHPEYYATPQPGAYFWVKSGLHEAALHDVCEIMKSRQACAAHNRYLRFWSW